VSWLEGGAELVVSLAMGCAVWTATPYLLLGRRVPAMRLTPVAVLSSIGMVGVAIWSAIWMPRAFATSAREFGIIGVGFAMLTWLVAIACVLTVAASGGAVIADRLERRRPTA
jgi:membrane protein